MDLLEDIPALLNLSWAQIGAAASGVLALATLVYKFFSLLHQTHKLEKQVDDLRALVNEKVEQEGSLKQTINELRDDLHTTSGERDAYKAQRDDLQSKISDTTRFDGRLWDRPLRVTPPDFIPPSDRRTRFIAVANLKGGVGKTTVAANAAVALARRGKSVLLVDLDFQGSLTRLCATPDMLAELLDRNETVHSLLTLGNDAPPGWLRRVSHPVKGFPRDQGTCRFIAASDELAEVELREEARWFVERDPDVRFCFRKQFHSLEVFNEYDYVIYDCPPRLTTACVNALACSDGVLIPIILDQQSAAPIQYMVRALARLAILRAPPPIGVVANQVTLREGKPISRQQDTWKITSDWLARNRMGPDQVFRCWIPTSASIAEAANAGTIAALDPTCCKQFDGLAKNIERTFHESVTVHQFA